MFLFMFLILSPVLPVIPPFICLWVVRSGTWDDTGFWCDDDFWDDGV